MWVIILNCMWQLQFGVILFLSSPYISALQYTVFEDSIPQTLSKHWLQYNYEWYNDIVKTEVHFGHYISLSATTLTTTSTLPPEVTVASIVPVLFLLLLLILIPLIVVAVMRKNRKNAVGAAPSEVELHSHERWVEIAHRYKRYLFTDLTYITTLVGLKVSKGVLEDLSRNLESLFIDRKLSSHQQNNYKTDFTMTLIPRIRIPT